MQSTTTTATADETVLICISRRDDRFIARWSAGRIQAHMIRGGSWVPREFSGTTVAEAIGTVLDSIWEEAYPGRRRGRRTNRSKLMERLVQRLVRVVIEIESSPFGSLRTSRPTASTGAVPPQVWPPSTTDSVH